MGERRARGACARPRRAARRCWLRALAATPSACSRPRPRCCLLPAPQETFLRGAIKVDGKKGKLEGKVDIKREGGKVTIEASGATTYAKRYFKYLTKKYLKKCVLCGGRKEAGKRGGARPARTRWVLVAACATPSACSRPRPRKCSVPQPQAAAARLPARARLAEQQGARARGGGARLPTRALLFSRVLSLPAAAPCLFFPSAGRVRTSLL